jgi:two-component system response regulator NreC
MCDMTASIRIIIADDHTIFRSGLNMLLNSEPDIDVVGEAEDGHAAVAAAVDLHPDVVLMDIGMPNLNGIEATKKIKEQAPDIHILVLTMHRSDEYFFKMLEAGASGYILKGAETSELISAVRAVANGDVFLYPSMAGRLVKEFLQRSAKLSDPSTRLTEREMEILQMIAKGFTNKEIASRSVLSPSTVHSHRANLLQKLQLNSRRELVQYAIEHGLLNSH